LVPCCGVFDGSNAPAGASIDAGKSVVFIARRRSSRTWRLSELAFQFVLGHQSIGKSARVG
jgi:hypothetical protein